MVYRVFVEKKSEYAHEAKVLLNECRNLLGIEGLLGVRLLNRYDAENMSREIFDRSVKTVFSEPQTDVTFETLEDVQAAGAQAASRAGGTDLPDDAKVTVFAVEYLPGQFNQRADSAAQCIQFISGGERSDIASATVYVLYGDLSDEDLAAIKKHVINPVEAREAKLELPETIKVQYDIPTEVAVLDGFNDYSREEMEQFVSDNGLAMDVDDAMFCQDYFRKEGRCPTITEIKVIDTYWSDHCRHTTFNTIIEDVKFLDPDDLDIQKAYEDYLAVRKEMNREKPVCLFDIGTLAAKYLRQKGLLEKLDESEEINACTVKIEVEADGVKEPWLLLFKNETHNHPTEIEPFGGAATCIGGAIRDPLSGRSYVYAAMRLTGAADPRTPVADTIPGKLPQRKLVTGAAHGYSSYGNQIGLTTGIVDELYHPGYAAKHMEVGAVIAAAPAENVRRERPAPGDVVILLGGATGRDGIGGATGSSKAHDSHSVETCGAEVQKGNAPEERKLQRLFRNKDASIMIKRCNDFGAGGVSVAIGELADGLKVDLNAVPKKYEGLDGTELAISESQERMAVVVEAKDLDAFLALADEENLNAVKVAEVTESPRLVLQWNGKNIVDISREFLDTNGAKKYISIEVEGAQPLKGLMDDAWKETDEPSFEESMKALAGDLNVCSKRGLSEMFDSTIGAGSVLMPFGGKYQQTPVQAMVHKISMEKKHTDDCSVMSWGYNPVITSQSPFHGAYLAVVESVSKLVAAGAEFTDVYLSFQEYFKKLGKDSKRWGQPFAAVLGAFRAQVELGVAAIGGKDSMSGSFENLDVPPTLISFAVTTDKCENIVSGEFKNAGDKILWIRPETEDNDSYHLPKAESLKQVFGLVTEILRNHGGVAAYTPTYGGVAEALLKMSLGNRLGIDISGGITDSAISMEELFGYNYGSFLVEVPRDFDISACPEGLLEGLSLKDLGRVNDGWTISYKNSRICIADLYPIYEDVLEDIYPCNNIEGGGAVLFDASEGEASVDSAQAPSIKVARPKVLITAFPGTNCEYDSAKAVADAGAEPTILVINNLSAEGIKRSVDEAARIIGESQMIFLPGGFSGGDEPDGSAKFITAFFRNDQVKEAVTDLIDQRGGLMCGICNGFQALIKLGLVPYGKIIETDASCPTLTFNTIGRHQSKIVRTKIVSTLSPWLSLMKVGDIVNVPISHGEGRFIAEDALIEQLRAKGQIATQYVDMDGNPTYDIAFNPNNSMAAIEGITSPDGRIFGKMGHSERIGSYLYKNVPGEYNNRMFEAAVAFFKN